MKENYKPIGDYIRVVNQKNKDLNVSQLIGLSIDKCYIPSVANIIGTDLSNYKIIKKNQFACSLMQVSRDGKIPIACMTEYDEAIMSPAYVIFEIIDENVVLPQYLDMWFMRSEFDREASFLAVGGVRGSLAWDDFCRMEFPLLPLSEQKEIVKAYQIIEDRITLKKQINDNLREIATLDFFEKIRYRRCEEDNCQVTEIGTYPSDWRIATLGDVLETIIDRRGVTPTKLGSEWSDEGIIALSAKSVKNHELVNLDIANRVDEKLYDRWMQQKLKSQDILMTSEAPLGEFYYLADFCEYCLSQRLFAIRANKAVIEPTLLYFQLTDTVGKHQIDIRSTGTTVTGIRQSELIKVPVVIPPKDIQAEFARLCDPIMVAIEKNADEIAHLQSLSTVLMAQLSSC